MRGEAGTSLPMIMAAGAVLTGVGGLAGLAVSANVVHTRAEAVADVVALSAAGALLDADGPCVAAAETAAANGAEVVLCEPSGTLVRIEVGVPLPEALARAAGRRRAIGRAAAQMYVDAGVGLG